MKPTDLRGILRYVPRFRDRTFVIGVDGGIVTDENFTNILTDVAVLRSLSIRVVIVHGAGAQIAALARERGLQASDLDGSGITDEPTLELALAASNRLTHEVLEGLSAHDLRAVSSNAVVAHPLGILRGRDHLNTGKVERVDHRLLDTLLTQRIIPVVPPLGFDGEGRTYRVNSDAVAVALADALDAVKIIFITPRDGLFCQGRLIRQVLAGDLSGMLGLRRSEIEAESVSKALHAVAACEKGVQRVHIINGKQDEALLAEVFSNEGVGTLVYANEYQQIRRALKKDVPSIRKLIQPSVASDELIQRTRAAITRELDDYFIFEIDRNPVACVALHPYVAERKAEVACLYVSSSHENQGIGRKLLDFVAARASQAGIHELFALSTQAFVFFQAKGGYVEGAPGDLPAARRVKYEKRGRGSKVLVKKLTDTNAG